MRKELSNENRQLSAQEIQNILLEYPYFQAARLLYLEKIKETPLYKEALHKEAIYAPDRKILFKMTEAVRHRWTQLYEVPNTQGSTYNNSFSLIDKFLENYSAESTEEQSKEQQYSIRQLPLQIISLHLPTVRKLHPITKAKWT